MSYYPLNNKETTFTYQFQILNEPPTNRLRKVTRPDSAVLETIYDDAAAIPWTKSITPIDPTNSVHVVTYSDGLGRTLQQHTWSGGGTLYSFTSTQYDALGRPFVIFNPRASVQEEAQWTAYTYDALSRVVTVTPPGSSRR